MAERARSFLIWGAGGHGKVVADLIRAVGHRVGGYVDRDASRRGQQAEPGGGRILAAESEWIGEVQRHHRLPPGFDALALAIGDNTRRYGCVDVCVRLAAPALVHPTATVSASAVIGDATVVFANGVINAAARLGRAVIVNSGAIVEHDCVIGDAAHLSPGAILCGTVHVGDRSWIGAGAVVIPNVRIGCDTMIGAGAVVIHDVPDGATVVGNPARTLHAELSEVAL